MSGLVYGLLWILFNVLARVLFRFRTRGTEHIPRTGGVLFAANHASYLDIPLLGCGIPRRVSFVGRASLFPHALINWIIRTLGWIPLKTGRVDRAALTEVVSRLRAGKAVVIFPEGTRTPNGGLQPGRPGIGVILSDIQCPVVPVYIGGTFDVLPSGTSWIRLHPVKIVFGKPMTFPASEGEEKKDYCRAVSQAVMDRIALVGGVSAAGADTGGSAAAPSLDD